jgi:hypothetical protein
LKGKERERGRKEAMSLCKGSKVDNVFRKMPPSPALLLFSIHSNSDCEILGNPQLKDLSPRDIGSFMNDTKVWFQ